MNLQQRVNLLVQLGEYIHDNSTEWQMTKQKASRENAWFASEFIDKAADSISAEFLTRQKLENWINTYNIPPDKSDPKNVGIVMAGNIPMVGFHDLLCTFISGHRQTIKLSSKDNVLIKHLVEQLEKMDPEIVSLIGFADMLKGCDVYIATGSNNSARYFDYYFRKVPHIIRRNRTAIAILNAHETIGDLARLADDVYLYFGLGCRNVTKIYVPEHYDFLPLLETFKEYTAVFENHKYRNNYDYQLAVLMINGKYYMTNGSIILNEDKSIFSPISVLNYEYYTDEEELLKLLGEKNQDLQCIVGKKYLDFGQAQDPGLAQYADGIDTMKFLLSI